MVGMVGNEGANGVAAAEKHQGVHGELSSAAQYLAKSAPTGFLQTVESSDALGATSALADAFIAALDAEDDGSGSLEGCMQTLLLWVKKECRMDETLVTKISNGVCAGVSMGDLRLKCMALLYNAVSEEHAGKRFELLTATISLSAATGLVEKIADTVLPKVDMFLRQWQVGVPEKRTMYRVCYEALKSTGRDEDAFTFNVKQLELYNGATEAECASVESATVDVIVQAVCLPKLYRFDTLLELTVVKRMEGMDGDFKLLFELISIFVRDDLAAFSAFASSNAALLAKHGIDVAQADDKMRLLTFASLGIDSQDLTYDMIAKALQIPEELVEEWVIRSIGSGLVDAKINQLKSSVSVYRSTQRMFTRGEWQPLSERINIWKENIGDLLTALRETREKSSSAAATAFTG